MGEAIGWLVALAIFLMIEIATLSLVSIWFAGGALLAFIVALLGGNLWIQFLVCSITAFVLIYFTRPIAMKHFNNNRTKTNYESLIGLEGRVTEEVNNKAATGTVILNGQEWTARCEQETLIIETGKLVEVVNIIGVKLIVKLKKESDV